MPADCGCVESSLDTKSSCIIFYREVMFTLLGPRFQHAVARARSFPSLEIQRSLRRCTKNSAPLHRIGEARETLSFSHRQPPTQAARASIHRVARSPSDAHRDDPGLPSAGETMSDEWDSIIIGGESGHPYTELLTRADMAQRIRWTGRSDRLQDHVRERPLLHSL